MGPKARSWGLGSLLIIAACAHQPPLKGGFPMGTWVVKRYIAPRDAWSAPAAHLAQRRINSTLVLSPDRADGLANCQPSQFKLAERDLALEDLFDPRSHGSFNVKDLGLKEPRAYQVRAFCDDVMYLSWDRTQLFLLRDGYLLVLEPAGRVRFERTPTPEPPTTPTPAVTYVPFGPRPTPEIRE